MPRPLAFTPRTPHPYKFACKCLVCTRAHQHKIAAMARYIRKLRKKGPK